jgi:glucose/arabinose dehydrogenase
LHTIKTLAFGALVLSIPLFTACGDDDDDDSDAPPGVDAGVDGGDDLDGGADGGNAACAEGNGGLVLPEGFCASVFADGVERARHIAVTASGDVFIAGNNAPDGTKGKIYGLRDADDDGVAETRVTFGAEGADGIVWRSGELFVGHNDRVVRYALTDGELEPTGEPTVIVGDLPTGGDHDYKNILFAPNGDLMVNIGSATNSCQVENRVDESPGIPGCPERATRAGIWRFSSTEEGQVQGDGTRFVTGLRNGEAMNHDPAGQLWSAQNGRDQLFDNWPEFYTEADELRLPGETLYKLDQNDDLGWPFCYYDPEEGAHVLAPEYGGNGTEIGDCVNVEDPASVFPAHWAPLSLLFYTGDLFPARYKGGMFVAFHGSWADPNAIDPPGYQVGFVPFAEGAPAGEWETFADDFAGPARPLPEMAEHRPVGLAQAPDGTLYITDDHAGRVWRVYYNGSR